MNHVLLDVCYKLLAKDEKGDVYCGWVQCA